MKRIGLILSILTLVVKVDAQTIVEQHGQLHVDGNRIKDEHGEITQLRGMSFFWHQWDESAYYMNEEVISWLVEDWKIQLVRVPIGVRNDDCTVMGTAVKDDFTAACGGPDTLSTGKEWGYATARMAIDAAIANGIYVTLDWHTHDIHLEEAKEFFSTMAEEYGDYPNITYEIFNEPTGSSWTDLHETWPDIKEYALEIIPVIRAHDPDNIIIVGTPFYSQFVDHAADDPITVDSDGEAITNIAYTIHAYTGTHGQETLDRANYALDKGLALWMTECGRVGTNFGPNNNVNYKQWKMWEEWMDNNGVSWTKWSLGKKHEVSSSLMPSASVAGGWVNDDLRSEGLWNRAHFRAINCPSCPGFELSEAVLEVYEPDHTDDFSISLKTQPTSDVVFQITVTDDTEVVVPVSTVTFTPDNWDTPQTVSVSAFDDELVDSDKLSEVRVAIDHTLSSPEYAEVFDQMLRVTTFNTDKFEEPEPPLSIGEVADTAVYPNPWNSGALKITLEEDLGAVELELMDLAGKTYFTSSTVINNDLEIKPIDLPDGVYLLHIHHAKGTLITKIIRGTK